MRDEIQALKSKLAGTSIQAPSLLQRDEGLAQRSEDLARQLKEARSHNERLMKQLQREKAANVGKLHFMAGSTDKSGIFEVHEDDEEPLARPAKKFAPHPAVNAMKKQLEVAAPLLKKNAPGPTYGVSPSSVSPLTNCYLATNKHVPLKKTTEKAPDNPERASTTTTSKKRKRSNDKPKTILDEVADLPTFDKPLDSRRGGRHRRVPYSEAEPDEDTIILAHRPKNHALAPIPVEFTAICDYLPNGNVNQYFPSSELTAGVADLWQRIDICARNIWTKQKGEDWQYDFQRTDFKPKGAVCVSEKCQGRRAAWRPGFEGVFACKSCVRENRPCVVYVLKSEWYGEGDKGEFRLLPLHEGDRRRPVKKDFETRWWINDEGMEEGIFSDDEDEFVDS